MKTVVLDAGHGGADPGAVGQAGTMEKNIVLSVVMRMRDRLSKNLRVVVTRDTDEFISLAGRSAIANALHTDLFVSIHCNAARSKNARGFEVFTTIGQTKADEAATLAFDHYRKSFPHLIPRADMSDGDPDKEVNFSVLRRTKAPAYLFELGFISNSDEEREMASSEFQSKAADSLSAAIEFFLGVDHVEESPGHAFTLEQRVERLEQLIRDYV